MGQDNFVRGKKIGWIGAGMLLAAVSVAQAQQTTAPATPPAAQAADGPMVPPAKPGVFSMQKKSAVRYHLAVTGHKFTSRDDIEKYLLYRAAELTLEQKS